MRSNTLQHQRPSQPVRRILRVTADTVNVHDMTFMSYLPQMYEDRGLHRHRSCAQNAFKSMRRYGMKDTPKELEPFNCFQNTLNYSLKAMVS